MLNRISGRFARIPSRSSLAAGGTAIVLAFGLKAFYSRAGADGLLWILAPSAWLARFVGGIDLAYEPGAGFISHRHHLVVGPSCAGINFLVIGFLTMYFSFASRVSGKVRWIAYSAVVAFTAAVVANGLRIFISAHLWNADIYGTWITPEAMHRLAGTAIYYGSLVALYLAVESWLGIRSSLSTRTAPLVWYLGVSLGVPLVGRIATGGLSGFAEHAIWVAATAILLTLVMFLPSRAAIKYVGGHETQNSDCRR
jgi:exosortase K